LPINEGPIANAQLIHNAADLALEVVDVYVNGELSIDDFTFRDATDLGEAPAGQDLLIQFAPGTSTSADESIWETTVNFDEGQSYVLIAHGIFSETGYAPAEPFTVSTFVGAQLAAADNTNTDVLVFHGATDAPTVDLWEVGVGAGGLIDDLAYSNFSVGYAALPTDNYYLQVRLEDGVTPVVTYSLPLEGAGLIGGAGVAFASGFLDPSVNSDGPAFGIFVALVDGTVIELPALGAAPDNNLCDDATAVTVGQLGDNTCANNQVTGDLTNAWNSTLVTEIPACELPGIITDAYYTFNTGDFNQLTIDVSSLVSEGTEVGYEIYTACGAPWGEVGGCVFNASVLDPFVVNDIPLNTDLVIRLFTNQDFGSESGEFTLCIEGDFVDSVNEVADEVSFNVFPNPSNGQFSVEVPTNGAYTVNLTDLTGRVVLNNTIETTGKLLNVDASAIVQAGIYNVVVSQNGNVLSASKLIVE